MRKLASTIRIEDRPGNWPSIQRASTNVDFDCVGICLRCRSSLYRVKANTTRYTCISYIDSLSDRQLDKPDWKSSIKRYGVDKTTRVYLAALIGTWYWPTPSMNQVTDDITLRELKSHITDLPTERWSEITYQGSWCHKARLLWLLMRHNPPITGVSET